MILDCKSVADSILESVAAQIKNEDRQPFLAGIRVEGDLGAASYAAGIKKDCERVGIFYTEYVMSPDDDVSAWNKRIMALNDDEGVDGIIVIEPMPSGIIKIKDEKDVDNIHSSHYFDGCTAIGVLELLSHYGIETASKDVVVIGRNIGLEIAYWMLKANATVTVCHSLTSNLKEHCQRADILISATGRHGLIDGYMIKPGATVIDVGRGDVDFESALGIAGALTPAKGGTGLITRAVLMSHVTDAKAHNIS